MPRCTHVTHACLWQRVRKIRKLFSVCSELLCLFPRGQPFKHVLIQKIEEPGKALPVLVLGREGCGQHNDEGRSGRAS